MKTFITWLQIGAVIIQTAGGTALIVASVIQLRMSKKIFMDHKASIARYNEMVTAFGDSANNLLKAADAALQDIIRLRSWLSPPPPGPPPPPSIN